MSIFKIHRAPAKARRLRLAAAAGTAALAMATVQGLEAPAQAEGGTTATDTTTVELTEATASQKAVRTGQEVEADDLTTPTSRVVALPNGSFRAEVSALPVRVEDESGDWQPVDNTLIRTAEGEITPKRPAARMTFSAGGDDALARIENDDRTLAVSWPNGDLPEPELVGSAAHYRDVLPGVSLVAQAGSTGFSTFVVVESREAAMNPAVREFALDVEADGVRVSDTTTGGLEAKDGAETVFTAPQPLMWDSEGVNGTDQQSFSPEEKAVDAPLTPPVAAEPVKMPMQASDTKISLAVPAQVLNDPATVYPVVLDPGITTAGIDYGGWTMLWSNGTTMYNHPTEMARVGYDGWSGSPKKSRSFFHMDVPLNTLEGAAITSATFTHRQIHSPQNTCGVNYGPAIQIHRTERFTASSTWSNQPAVLSAHGSDAFGHGNEASCPGFDRQSFNVLSGVQAAVAEGKDLTLRMKSADEADRNGWRKYDNTQLGYPELSITYYKYPKAPATVGATSQVAGTSPWTSDAATKLQATNVIDPNGGPGYAQFKVIDSSTGATTWTGVAAADAAHTATTGPLPAGALTNGRTYTLQAFAAVDSAATYKSSTPASASLRIDTTTPAAPVALSPASATEVDNLMAELSGTVTGAGALRGHFQVRDVLTGQILVDSEQLDPEAEAFAASTVTSGQPSAFEIPEDILVPGHPYEWRMRTLDSEPSPGTWTLFQPFQTWNEVPAQDISISADGGTSSCLSGSGRPAVATHNPTVNATIQDLDRANGPETFAFEAELLRLDGEHLVTSTSSSAPEGTYASWQIPAIHLSDGGTYKLRLRNAELSGNPQWSTFCEFTVTADGVTVPPTEVFTSLQDGTTFTAEPTDGDSVEIPTVQIASTEPVDPEDSFPTDLDAQCGSGAVCLSFEAPAGGGGAEAPQQGEAMTFSSLAAAPGEPSADTWDQCLIRQAAAAKLWRQMNRRASCIELPWWGQYRAGNVVTESAGRFKQKMWANGTRMTIQVSGYLDGPSNAIPTYMVYELSCKRCSSTGRLYLHMSDQNANPVSGFYTGKLSFSIAVGTKAVVSVAKASSRAIGYTADGLEGRTTWNKVDTFRCDSLVASPACVFPEYKPIYRINENYPEVQEHVATALRSGLPGDAARRSPLHRIRQVGSLAERTAAAAAINSNRYYACKTTQVPQRPTGRTCDEYPFAASAEGAAANSNNARTFEDCHYSPDQYTSLWKDGDPRNPTGFSRCFVKAGQNSGEGPSRRAFLDSEHVLNGDAFYVAA